MLCIDVLALLVMSYAGALCVLGTNAVRPGYLDIGANAAMSMYADRSA